MNLGDFIHIVKRVGLEYFQKYYAIYPGIVSDNEDPEQRGRIKITLPSILGEGKPLAHWVSPIGRDLAGKKTGSFFPPYVGDVVDVMFENGNINAPRYMGGFWSIDELPDEFLKGYPNVKGWVFKSKQKILIDESDGKLMLSFVNGASGGFLVLDDTAGKEAIYITHKKGSLIQIDKDGSIIQATSEGCLFSMDNKKKEILICAPDGSFIKLGKGVVISDPTGSNFLNVTEKSLELNAKDLVQSTQNLNNNSGTVGLGANAFFSSVIGENLEAYLAQLTVMTALGPSSVPIIQPSIWNAAPPTSFKSLYVKVKPNVG